MGVPTFFRWIQEKYPKIVVRAVEQHEKVPGAGIDATQPNPNNYEFDNLYLDMNGLIHPCTHPEGEEAPATEEDMYLVIFRYLDRLFNLIRPRKLIYMAIDGVAPRAKMNQQRSRRFRSAQEAEEAEADADRIRREMVEMGIKPPPRSRKKPWDSNVITPGTEFMATLSDWLRHYIAERLNLNPAFKNVRVILSDAQSPGEGEHKIMQFIRRERAEPGYDPDTRHCLYGLDADLIMLGLASHEIHFTILREEVKFGKKKNNNGYRKDAVLNGDDDDDIDGIIGKKKKPFDLVRLWVLREYLAYEFRPQTFYQQLPFQFNFEACIDDFVFICFFVGNDFLPHLPSLSIREGGLELLLDLYRRVLPTVGGYLTTDGIVNLKRVDVFMGVLGTVEDEIFRRRRATELYDKQRRANSQRMRKQGGVSTAAAALAAATARPVARKSKHAAVREAPAVKELIPLGRGRARKPIKAKPAAASKEKETPKPKEPPKPEDNKVAAAALREKLGKKRPLDQEEKQSKKVKSSEETPGSSSSSSSVSQSTAMVLTRNSRTKREKDHVDNIDLDKVEVSESPESLADFERRSKEKEKKRNIHDDVVDEVRLGESGWKDRYYSSKFGSEYRGSTSPQRKKVVESYVTGLCWVMEYYYRGCQSWTWFYEYHYAPFASDLVNIDEIKVNFAPSEPFKPIDQLMGVFPPASAHALPEPCRWFMCDEDSPIADFYPTDFKYDPNGKAVRWLWVALLPFIDETRLLKVTRSLEDEFTDRDKQRNECNPDLIFANVEAPGTTRMMKAAEEYEKKQKNKKQGGSSSSFADVKLAKQSFTPTTAGDVRAGGSQDSGRLVLAPDTNGIGGYFLPPPKKFAWEINQPLPSLNKRLIPITENKVVCLEFRLPKMKPHLSLVNPKATIPPPSLTIDELNTKPPRLGRGANVSNILIEQHGNNALGKNDGLIVYRAHARPPPPQHFRGSNNLRQNFANSGLLRNEQPSDPYYHGQNTHHGGRGSYGGSMEPRHKQQRYGYDHSRRYDNPTPSMHNYRNYDNRGGYGGARDYDDRYNNQRRSQPPPGQPYPPANQYHHHRGPPPPGRSQYHQQRSAFHPNAPPPAGNASNDTSRNALLSSLSNALKRRGQQQQHHHRR